MALTRLLRFQELPSFRHLVFFFNVFRVQLYCTKIFENSSVEVGQSWCNEFDFGFGISILLLNVGEVEFHLSKHKCNVLALPEQSFQYLYCMLCWRNKMQNADLHDMGYSLSSPKRSVSQVSGYRVVTRLCFDLRYTGINSRVLLPNPVVCETGLMDDLDFFHYDFSS